MSRQRPKGSAGWWFQRVSGVLLIFFVGLHFVDVHFIRGLDNLNFEDVAAKWNQPGWRIADAILLVLAMVHGTNGVESVLEDYAGARRTQRVWRPLLRGLVAIISLLGAWVLITFQPGTPG
ncbi:succinate dehydrogenase, hydrophobic membrane anchor protein [bacterium]|nr:succinate dehydrogenase, hydrophobic membrane anchor protein [bacterium]